MASGVGCTPTHFKEKRTIDESNRKMLCADCLARSPESSDYFFCNFHTTTESHQIIPGRAQDSLQKGDKCEGMKNLDSRQRSRSLNDLREFLEGITITRRSDPKFKDDMGPVFTEPDMKSTGDLDLFLPQCSQRRTKKGKSECSSPVLSSRSVYNFHIGIILCLEEKNRHQVAASV